MGTVIVVVTCDLCGQTWHRRGVTAEQFVECVFCGNLGRLRFGPLPYDDRGPSHVMASLQCERSTSG